MLPARLTELVRPYYLKWFYFYLASNNCPPAFRRWMAFRSVSLGPALRQLVPEQQDVPDAIFFPMADWHSIKQRTQQLTEGMASLGHRCLYLNPHLGREFPRPYPLSRHRLVTFIEPRILELHVHLLHEPVFHHRRLRSSEVETLGANIDSFLDATGSTSQVAVISFPLWLDVGLRLRATRGTPLIYDCHDLLEGFEGISADLIRAESDLMREADLVVFSAEWLSLEHIARMPDLAQKSVVIKNAVDPAHFRSAIPARGERNGKKTVGYLGSLNTWFDVDAVLKAAHEHPEWRFLLVGPRADAFPDRALKACANVEFIGEVPYSDVPAWMAKFDVAIIPFVVQPLTMATNPVKLYEYFACGLPIVSSPLGEVERYKELVYIAATPSSSCSNWKSP